MQIGSAHFHLAKSQSLVAESAIGQPMALGFGLTRIDSEGSVVYAIEYNGYFVTHP
jgi:hypothetical protein